MTSPVDATEREELLAELLANLLEEHRLGKSVDMERVADQHPELAREIRSLWATAMVADHFVSCMAQGGEVTTPTSSSRHSEENLPRAFGDYELLEEIGRGGMGVVYRARQRSLARTVAIKMILRGELASGPDIARFRAEAESAAHLAHPNVVPVHEVGERDGQPYFTMKYVEGTTLAKRLADGPLPPREAAEILIPVCRAIAEAHRRGILHRDLKPSNVLLDEEGRPHVTDFGLAKRVTVGSSVTGSGMILGTPSYMPPEQAAGTRGELGPAGDVYSLGAILYHTLTGRPPFQAASPLDTVLMVLDEDPLPPRVINRRADPELEIIALKCLEKSPLLRYASADDLASDLEAFLANEPIGARSTSVKMWVTRIFRDTHHAPLLESWGLLWMLHSFVILIVCLVTDGMSRLGVDSPGPYLGLWMVGLSAWGAIFWNLRRRGGPITFIERQIAHVWGASIISGALLFLVEILLGLPVLTLSPVLALFSGTVFLMKAAILSGVFYIQAIVSFVCALVMAQFPAYGLLIFGFLSWAFFFIPGLKYYLRRERTRLDG